MKAALVREVDENVLPIFHAYRHLEQTYATNDSLEKANRVYIEWYDSKDAVADNIEAYFRDARELQNALHRFNSGLHWASILLFSTPTASARHEIINKWFGRDKGVLAGLVDCIHDCDGGYEWFRSFVRLEEVLHQRKRRLIEELLMHTRSSDLSATSDAPERDRLERLSVRRPLFPARGTSKERLPAPTSSLPRSACGTPHSDQRRSLDSREFEPC